LFCVPKKATTNSIRNLIKVDADWLCDRPNIWFLFLSVCFFFLFSYTAQFFIRWRVFFSVSVVFLLFADLIFYWQMGGVPIYYICRGVINPRTLTDFPSPTPPLDQGHIGSPPEDYHRLTAFEAKDLPISLS